PDVQMTRLMKRNRLDALEARRRIDAQPPLAAKRERADRVIDNSGTLEQTRQQVVTAWNDLLTGAPA
ncbi:MAG: dephospho-CoA kinase, partial [Thermomicrobiales bacterium]